MGKSNSFGFLKKIRIAQSPKFTHLRFSVNMSIRCFWNCHWSQALKNWLKRLDLTKEHFLAWKWKKKKTRNLFIRFFQNFMWWYDFSFFWTSLIIPKDPLSRNFLEQNWQISYFLFHWSVFLDSLVLEIRVQCYLVYVLFVL